MNLVVFIMKSIKEQVEYLRDFVVDEKNALFDRLIQERTDYVTVVLEDLFQSHNQSAVMRSADCYGIQHVHLIENRNSYDMTSTVSQGARDWLSIHRHKELENNTQATIDQLRAEGYRILATTPHANDIFVDDIDLEKGKMAFFFGTELTGLSDLVIGQADEFVKIPMYGFTESLNVSVCAAITMYSVTRRLRGSGIDWHLSDRAKDEILFKWYKNAIKASGKEGIIGVGFDKSDAIMNLINDGYLLCTMAQNPDVMGEDGVKAAVAALEGQDQGGKVTDTGVSVIKK